MFKQKIIIYSVVFLNLLFISKLSLEPLIISNINYSFIGIMIVFAFIIRELYGYFMSLDKKNKIYISISIAIIIPIVIFYKKEEFLYFIQNSYINNFKIILQCIKEDVYILFVYLRPFFAILIPIITLVSIKIYTRNNYSLLIFDSILLIGLWYGFSTKLVKESLVVFSFIFIYTLTISKYLTLSKQNIKNINRTTNWNYVFALAFTFAFTCNFIILFLPKDKPIITLDLFPRLASDKEFNASYSIIPEQEKAITLADFNTFNYKQSGFSSDENESLGGPMTLGHDPVMNVTSDRETYIRGITFDTYKNNSWSNSSLYLNKPQLNADNSYTIRMFPDKSYLNLSDHKMDIELFEDNLTNSIFLPLNSDSIIIDDPVYVEYRNFDTVRSSSDNSLYSISYKLFNNGIEGVDEFIKVKHRELPSFMSYPSEEKKYGVTIVPANPDSLPYLSDDNIPLDKYYSYLQVPNNVPFEVYDLVYSIIEGASTNHEKVMLIKKYLYDNYTYTLDISVVPDNEEFVSYFLFKEKKGYCVYFSTAMTIMCRIAGVPARYVEGYALKQDSLIDTDKYLVKQNNAHAWCEVLAYPNDNIWVIADPLIPVTEELDFNNSIPEPPTENPVEEKPIEENDPSNNKDSNDAGTTSSNIIVYIIFIIISYAILVLVTNKQRYDKISNSNTMLDLHSYALRWLKELKISLNFNESDRDILRKIKNYELKNLIEKIIDSSYNEYYGNITQYSIKKQDYLDTLISIMKSELGLPKYYLIKIFKLK